MPRKNQGWITFQASEEERQLLERYCQRSQRSKTDILRELVRSLDQPQILQPEPAASPSSVSAEGPTSPDNLAASSSGPPLTISARNLLRAKITRITLSEVSAEITLMLGPGTELTSVITRASAERLRLAHGQEVYAVIKANSIMIASLS